MCEALIIIILFFLTPDFLPSLLSSPSPSTLKLTLAVTPGCSFSTLSTSTSSSKRSKKTAAKDKSPSSSSAFVPGGGRRPQAIIHHQSQSHLALTATTASDTAPPPLNTTSVSAASFPVAVGKAYTPQQLRLLYAPTEPGAFVPGGGRRHHVRSSKSSTSTKKRPPPPPLPPASHTTTGRFNPLLKLRVGNHKTTATANPSTSSFETPSLRRSYTTPTPTPSIIFDNNKNEINNVRVFIFRS